MLAFRCKSCGHLEGCDHAGDHHHPHQCRVCGKGVVVGASAAEVFAHADVQCHEGAKAHAACADREKSYRHGGRLIKVPFHGMTVYKLLVPENWEVLADCDDARLAELGLGRQHVVRHAPKGAPKGDAKLVTAAARDGAKVAESA